MKTLKRRSQITMKRSLRNSRNKRNIQGINVKNVISALTMEKTSIAETVKPLRVCAPDNGRWTRIEVAVDSGACDSVISMDDLLGSKDRVRETVVLVNGINFVAANGDPINNYGEVEVPMLTREHTLRPMQFQAVGVSKPFGSVQKMVESNHTVVLDSGGS